LDQRRLGDSGTIEAAVEKGSQQKEQTCEPFQKGAAKQKHMCVSDSSQKICRGKGALRKRFAGHKVIRSREGGMRMRRLAHGAISLKERDKGRSEERTLHIRKKKNLKGGEGG